MLERGDDSVQAGVEGVLESSCLRGGGGSVGDGGEGIRNDDGGGDDGDVVRQHGGDAILRQAGWDGNEIWQFIFPT